MAAHVQLYTAHNKLLRSCRTPVVMIMNSSGRITGAWGIPHCSAFCALVLCPSPHYFF